LAQLKVLSQNYSSFGAEIKTSAAVDFFLAQEKAQSSNDEAKKVFEDLKYAFSISKTLEETPKPAEGTTPSKTAEVTDASKTATEVKKEEKPVEAEKQNAEGEKHVEGTQPEKQAEGAQ
jgi:hypothetical protein